MADLNIRSDSVNVEQIMEQIRERIREKRDVDYTEEQIKELAAVKLERFLDPRGVRSDLLEQFRRARPLPPERPNYAFEEQTLYESHRAPLRWIRRLLRPLLKLFFNPNPLIQALNIQSRLNDREARLEGTRHELDQLNYEVIHNLVVEVTRMGIEVKNVKMRVESLTSRLEFNERRARALEGVVLYKPPTEGTGTVTSEGDADEEVAVDEARPDKTSPEGEGPGQRSRRRRRRRGRRSGASAASVMTGTEQTTGAESIGDTAASRGVVSTTAARDADTQDAGATTSSSPGSAPTGQAVAGPSPAESRAHESTVESPEPASTIPERDPDEQ
jgi:hypothetical protein